jgi:hypothetical protein
VAVYGCRHAPLHPPAPASPLSQRGCRHGRNAIRPKSGHIRPTGFRWPVSHRADLPVSETAPWQSTAPTLHDLQPRDVFRELLHEKQIEGDELTAVFDELLALREARAIA